MAKLPGKKIGPLWIEIGDQRIELELRIDARTGRFYTAHNGETFEAASVDELKAKVSPAVKVANSLTWTRYIELNYESHDARSSWGDRRGLTERPPSFVRGISLTWTVKDFSSKHIPARETDEVILEREVSEDGTTDLATVASRTSGRGPHRKYAEIPPDAILYTPEREAALREMRNRLTALDRELRAVLAGDREEVAARLDQPLKLTMPPPFVPKAEPHHEDYCDKHEGGRCDCGAEEAA
jgi:hypothetical protein